MRTLTVVCPVRDEEAVILAFHEELSRVLAGLEGWSASALYVVDGGTDRTRELLRGLAAADRSVRVLALSSHFGQQAALLAGLDHCDADAVVMMDGDLQHPPALIPDAPGRAREGVRRRLHRPGGHAGDPAREAPRRALLLPPRPRGLRHADPRGGGRLPAGVAAGGRGLPAQPPRARPVPEGPLRVGRLSVVRRAVPGGRAARRADEVLPRPEPPLRPRRRGGLQPGARSGRRRSPASLVSSLGLLAAAAALWGWLREGSPPPWSVALAIFGLVSGAQLALPRGPRRVPGRGARGGPGPPPLRRRGTHQPLAGRAGAARRAVRFFGTPFGWQSRQATRWTSCAAVGRLEGRVHRLHVDPAVREARVAARARGARRLAVLRVAGQAAQPLVDARPACGRRRRRPASRPAARGTGSRAPAAGRGSSSRAARRPSSPASAAGRGPRARGRAGRRGRATAARSPASGPATSPRSLRGASGSPLRWTEWQARQGTAGRPAYSSFTNVHGPFRSSGVTRSRMPPSKCMAWQRRQSSMSCWLALCSGLMKRAA